MSVGARKKVPQGQTFNPKRYRLVYIPRGEAERRFLELHRHNMDQAEKSGHTVPSLLDTTVMVINQAHKAMADQMAVDAIKQVV